MTDIHSVRQSVCVFVSSHFQAHNNTTLNYIGMSSPYLAAKILQFAHENQYVNAAKQGRPKFFGKGPQLVLCLFVGCKRKNTVSALPKLPNYSVSF